MKRSYMRGCGTSAGALSGKGSAAGKTRGDAEVKGEAMTRCSLSQTPLAEGDVRVDPHGRLYSAAAAVQELVRLRSSSEQSGWVVKSSKHLHAIDWSPTLSCYLTGTALLSGIVPCYLVVTGPNAGSCVTAAAIKEMGREIVEGGTVKLLQSEEEAKETDERLEAERARKEAKKRKKKGKGGGDKDVEEPQPQKKKKKSQPAAPLPPPAAPSAALTSKATSSIFHSSADVKAQGANDLFACSGGRRF